MPHSPVQAQKSASTTGFVELPQVVLGLLNFNRTSNSHWGKQETIDALVRIGNQLVLNYSSMNVGHISKRDGSEFKPHKSHRTGVDVDIRPVRKDGRNLPVTIHQAQYDRDETRKLIQVIRQNAKVKLILFNDPVLVKEGLCQRYAGHDNHLHCRFDY